MSVRTARLAAVALVATLAAVPFAAADSHEEAPMPYLFVHYHDVDPARVMDHEAQDKAWVAAFTEAGMEGDEWEWYSYSHGFEYAYVSPFPNYAWLDNEKEREAELAEAIGEEKMKELMQGAGARAHRTEILKYREDLSYDGPWKGEPGFARVGVHHVKPGMGEAFENLVQEVMAAHKKAGSELDIAGHEVEFGDGDYLFVAWAKDASHFYSMPSTGAILNEAYGAEKAQKLYADWGESITDYVTTDWAFRPELSYMGPKPAAEDMKGEMEMEDEAMEGEE